MKTRLGAILLAGATVMLLSQAAAAGCPTWGLAGEWDSYTTGDVDGEAFYERCTLRFDAAGKVLARSTCRTDTGERSTVTGRLILDSNCRATGTLTQQFPGESPNVCTVPQSTLTKDLDVFAGVGNCKSAKTIFSFTMIRQ